MNTAAVQRPRTLADVIPHTTDRVWNQLRTAALVSGFAALTALFAQIQFALSVTPVPVTGQTFAVLLAGAALGWQRGIASQAVYWLVGIAMPIPWYSDD
ncbi:MAG TPA: biotin transporter BioY, partial [Ilumatobacter sp.]|nr:biotin transporter BioY [Ilumatobacter sp.]